MAFTNDEWYHLEYRLSNARRNMRYHDEYSEPWTRARLAMEEILSAKESNRIIPQVGDLITDTEYPTKALGVILEVRDRRKSKDVYRVLAGKGPMWLDKDYIEYQCRLLS